MMCDMEFHLKVSKLYLSTVSGMDQYNTRSSESQNFYINIPDCPFMLILFQESELNCGINMEQPSSTQSSSKQTENLHNFKTKLKTHLFKEAFHKEQ